MWTGYPHFGPYRITSKKLKQIMFTGIIEESAPVVHRNETSGGLSLRIQGSVVLEGTAPGESIAVNGTCLTVTRCEADWFDVGLAPETCLRTNLGTLQAGDRVNLERSTPANGRLDGHIVQGHVEDTAELVSRTVDGDSLRLVFEVPRPVLKYIVAKGYVAIDGISLTVVNTTPVGFSIMLIAFTQERVTLATQPVGYRANIETDIVGRYVERFMQWTNAQGATS